MKPKVRADSFKKNNLGKSQLSISLQNLKLLAEQSDLTIEKIRSQLGMQSHAFLIMILSLPFLTPIPLPGLSTVFGLIICFVSYSWAIKKSPWIPKRWLGYKISGKTLVSIAFYGEKISRKIEFFVRPRYNFIFSNIVFRAFVFAVLFLCASFLALPLPPGTNFPPAITIFIFALSILEEDFYLAVLGFIIFSINILLANQAVTLIQKYIPQIPTITNFIIL